MKYLLMCFALLIIICSFSNISVCADAVEQQAISGDIKAPVIENRFVATGTITDIMLAPLGIQRFVMKIEKAESHGDYPNFGNEYLGKSAEIRSEIGIPKSFKIGVLVSVIVRVSGDERGQALFLVEVLDNGALKK